MAGKQSSSSSTITKKSENGNGLILYQSYASYYCQKVVFALNEKKIKYKSRLVDLNIGEQLEPWFIKLNPKSEVPVLQDGVKIIPDSRRIIDYLEDNFSNGNTPRLIPEKGSPQYHIMERMRDLLDNLPIQLVTYGCVLHQELTGQIEYSPQEVKVKQGIHATQERLLNDLIGKYRDFKDYYLVKKSGLDKIRAMIADPNEVVKAVLDVEYALNTVEKELATHQGDKKDWWLCSDKFTIADISLCILLHRCQKIGLIDKFFQPAGSFPNLRRYYQRVQQRDSYRCATARGTGFLRKFRSLESKEQALVTIGGVAVVLAAAGIATFLVHRSK
ncbi:hypothetical protein JTE90_027870 [Oedothorax gibbosus]|uniref:Ganglioside-induced differentiation-associated protein 1 n=1 Tax=Oedothorax gibbosus TaxID=931172 RepID=A0AAV6U797_9ARAC|nr:hypothetical protein JTE90_027870 [Oedothorax gibbosus]